MGSNGKGSFAHKQTERAHAAGVLVLMLWLRVGRHVHLHRQDGWELSEGTTARRSDVQYSSVTSHVRRLSSPSSLSANLDIASSHASDSPSKHALSHVSKSKASSVSEVMSCIQSRWQFLHIPDSHLRHPMNKRMAGSSSHSPLACLFRTTAAVRQTWRNTSSQSSVNLGPAAPRPADVSETSTESAGVRRRGEEGVKIVGDGCRRVE